MASIVKWMSLWSAKGVTSLWGDNVVFHRLRSVSIELFESDAVLKRTSASPKLAHNVKGDQSSSGLGGGGVGGVSGGRNAPA